MTDLPMPKSDAKSMAELIRYEGRKARVVKIDNRWWVFSGRKRKKNAVLIEVCKTHGGYWGVFKTDAKWSIRISPREFMNKRDATDWMNKHKKR